MEEFGRDFERMQQLPAKFRNWLEYEANDTFLINPIFQYRMAHGRTFAELERFMRDFSRNQYIEDYAWTGETPPHRKGDGNEQLPQLRLTPVTGRQPRKSTVQVQRRTRPKPRRNNFLTAARVENDGDTYSPYR